MKYKKQFYSSFKGKTKEQKFNEAERRNDKLSLAVEKLRIETDGFNDSIQRFATAIKESNIPATPENVLLVNQMTKWVNKAIAGIDVLRSKLAKDNGFD